MHSHLVSICSSEDKLKFGIAEELKSPPLVFDFGPKVTILPKVKIAKTEREAV